MTGASDDDPSGIATYAQAGAKFQYGFLWTSLLTLPLMASVQEICDRTALASGLSLSRLAVRTFPKLRALLFVGIVALILANVLNIAADVVAVGEGMHLLHAGPSSLWALLAGAAVSVLVVAGSFETIARVFKVMCVALLSYVAVLAVVNASWSSVLSHTVIPHVELSKSYMLLLVAVLGTTISPYLFFWQNAHRIEERRDEAEHGDHAIPIKALPKHQAARKLHTSRADVFTGMVFSNVVMFSIIVATGSTLGTHHGQTITSAAQAAQALQPIAGSVSKVLFAVGFIGSGMLAIPVLAGAGSVAMSGLLHQDWGFSKSVRDAPMFYALVAFGTLGGTALTLLGIDPVKLLILSALINGLLAAPFLIVIMLVARNAGAMDGYTNGWLASLMGWMATALMAAAAIAYLALTYLA